MCEFAMQGDIERSRGWPIGMLNDRFKASTAGVCVCVLCVGTAIKIFNHGAVSRDFTFIDDVVLGVIAGARASF
jgi:nucleoside-diphosphate-sugar epimerase